ncbi:hypothetical protein [Leptolyngbya sp. FACHB-261]|uniref:hypothetical protein n=1 Tax=Leptolyngbya sp. FACHB-261 TaxID=2692806 RepID=UPI00168620F5|nr:hypothetical protein [Leptolyngbya sp. FACHB-261]
MFIAIESKVERNASDANLFVKVAQAVTYFISSNKLIMASSRTIEETSESTDVSDVDQRNLQAWHLLNN